ncbi:MAG: efflux RND transporter permease subunit [Dysgonamonadaceae bacterium]|jgi:multidrug efflux pump subunit AcrB|nr:efflux RND transporter permease subunit [Dysgonamonadaceae bacterium]
MVKYLIFRPIAVLMAFAAFFILGIITYLNVPVSLLPDIDIPEITIQITGKNMSARELENTVIAPVRQQLLQVNQLRDIRSEARDGNGLIRLSFEYGVDTDLSFIEVNEKIDAAMNYIPRDINRPRVVKASATDIPVFTLNLTLNNDSEIPSADKNNPEDIKAFLDLSEFAETVIKRQIEQLPQIAMVDVSGLIKKEVLIKPDNKLLSITGITLSDIESALNNNNIEPGSIIVRDGYYEYNIRFSAVLRTLEDIRHIYIRKNDKIYQLKDLAEIDIVPEKEKGMVIYNGQRAIAMQIIKQADENMANMQKALNEVIDRMQNTYPKIKFSISQNQTELLDYTISNLQQNLILAFIFVCIVSAFFFSDIKSPLIIGLTMFISLIITLLFFYLFHVSLNIISLTGLILALGMMIDNSIIVTDNIGQYRLRGESLTGACIRGTNDVIAPMLSSSFTTIAIFIPLVFLSGIAGALFFDQAFSVTVGLLVSYMTGIMLLPVLYKLVFTPKSNSKKSSAVNLEKDKGITLLSKIYDKGINWTFSHKIGIGITLIAIFPLCYLFFEIIPKDRMPDISQNELLVNIEWNENIHVDENLERTECFLNSIKEKVEEQSALVAQQQFLLNSEQEQTSTETQIYLRTEKPKEIEVLTENIKEYFLSNFPEAVVSFEPAGNVFEKLFTTGEAALVIEYYTKNRTRETDIQAIRGLEKHIAETTGEIPVGVSYQKQLNLHIDREKLLLYKVPYNEVYRALQTGFKANEFSVLRSYQQYLPIVLGNEEQNVRDVIDNIMVYTSPDEQGEKQSVPLSFFISTVPSEDVKTIIAGKKGEYIPMSIFNTDKEEKIMETIRREMSNHPDWEVDFSGSFFSNKKMINELIVVLIISLLLMYFILAAQFESFKQPFIVLIEIPIDVTAALGLLLLMGHSLNLMSAIGIIVTCGIVINDSILKVDVINQLRKEGYPLMEAIHEGGKRRLKAILLTSLTTIVCMAPLLFGHDMGSELEKPLAIATIGGMLVGTPVSIFVVPMIYRLLNRTKNDRL